MVGNMLKEKYLRVLRGLRVRFSKITTNSEFYRICCRWKVVSWD